ncbi:MAG: class I SAM-dependent methyltransferase [Patescibacteria group bacterium]|nr:class I SAM-dependent methyltransferase [Patescibacteria group bacterium]
MRCIICDSANLRLVSIKKINRSAYICHACSLVFLWPQPTPQEINEIYTESYYKSWGVSTSVENLETARLKKITAERYIKKIKPYVKGDKFLDIGCAFGYCMDVAQKHGFDVYGVELSSFSGPIARRKFKDKVFNGVLADAVFSNAYFDTITMFDLVEHIPDPLSFMCEARRIIKSGGIVGITTPNTDSISYKIFGTRSWFHWKLEHLGYFNRASIKELARRSGFRFIKSKQAYKAMSFQYLYDQFMIFPHPIFTPLARLLTKIIPTSIKHKPFFIAGGEMFVILRAE